MSMILPETLPDHPTQPMLQGNEYMQKHHLHQLDESAAACTPALPLCWFRLVDWAPWSAEV